MTAPERSLRETSDALVRDIEVLAALETEKRQLAPDDPRFTDLARRVEELAGQVLSDSALQRRIADHLETAGGAGAEAAVRTPIDDVPRDIHLILTEWREAERRSTAADSGSVEALEAEALAHHLREEYRRARDRKMGPG